MSDTARIVRCPQCGKPVPWLPAQHHKPFCSERCRLIDLGAWVNEEHRIEGDAAEPATPDSQTD
jgi:hypothetical protein